MHVVAREMASVVAQRVKQLEAPQSVGQEGIGCELVPGRGSCFTPSADRRTRRQRNMAALTLTLHSGQLTRHTRRKASRRPHTHSRALPGGRPCAPNLTSASHIALQSRRFFLHVRAFDGIGRCTRVPRVKDPFRSVHVTRPHRTRLEATRAPAVPAVVDSLERARLHRRARACPTQAAGGRRLKGHLWRLRAVAAISFAP